MKTPVLIALLSLTAQAHAAPPAAPRLSPALQAVINETGDHPTGQASRCLRSFREDLPDASRSVDPLLAKARGDYAVLWMVAEDGSISGTWTVRQTRTGGLQVSLRGGDEPPEDNQLNAAAAKRFHAAWEQVVTGDITEVRDVADGSCTLVYDGKRARLFLPGYGVGARDSDALEAALKILADAANWYNAAP